MERAAHGGGDAKPMARLRMPKPVPAHLQALEAAAAQLKNATPARREPRALEGSGGGPDADPATEATLRLLETHSLTEWQHDEHDRFMQALERFGREQSGDEWRKIAAFVRTRSADEVRHHGHCYLQQLVQDEYAGPPSLVGFGGRDFSDSQNDPNRQNLMAFASDNPDVAAVAGQSSKHWKGRDSSVDYGPPSFQHHHRHRHQDHHQTPNDAPRKSGRKPKVWTFEEDKIFENALASWNSDKPYSWQKIATALPGKTAKDARSRYEKLIGDVAMIETCGLEADPSYRRDSHSHYALHSPAHTRASRSSTLSDRIAPPPPIQVSDSADDDGGKGHDSLMLVSPGSATPSGAADGSASTLSPTFLEFLACEEKPPASSRDLSGGLTPLSSSSVLMPSPEHSRRSTSSSSYPSRSSGSRADSSSSARAEESSGKSGGTGGRARATSSGGFSTPRIWQEFLSDDFKFASRSLPSSDEMVAETSSTISQDLGGVNLLTPFASSPPSPPAASRRLRERGPRLHVERDEPSLDANELHPNERADRLGGR